MSSSDVVQIIGAGIAGLACARALHERGVGVQVVDRGRRPGGRMSSRTIDGRPTDLGASYFTAEPGSAFEAVVADWTARGLARGWTDTFSVVRPGGVLESSTGPMRFSAPGGLRSLAIDLADGLDLVSAVVDRAPLGHHPAVVLAMPDPQARRLLDPGVGMLAQLDDGSGWEPVISVVLGWPARRWPADLHGVFVNDSPEISFIADDGSRRGDGAAVLVVHTTPGLAREHLDEPDAVVPSVDRATRSVLGITEPPTATFAHRWTFARPAAQHPEPFLLQDGIGVCGDAWGPKSSVAAAWTSGHALGRELAARLAL